MKRQKDYRSVITSNLGNIGEEVENVIDYIQDSFGLLAEETLFEIKVVLNELIINAIKHGNKEDPGKHVIVEVKVDDPENLTLKVEDEGEGYDYRKTESAVMKLKPDECELDETGRGMQIVTSLSDHVEVSGCGNCIVITKRLKNKES